MPPKRLVARGQLDLPPGEYGQLRRHYVNLVAATAGSSVQTWTTGRSGSESGHGNGHTDMRTRVGHRRADGGGSAAHQPMNEASTPRHGMAGRRAAKGSGSGSGYRNAASSGGTGSTKRQPASSGDSRSGQGSGSGSGNGSSGDNGGRSSDQIRSRHRGKGDGKGQGKGQRQGHGRGRGSIGRSERLADTGNAADQSSVAEFSSSSMSSRDSQADRRQS